MRVLRSRADESKDSVSKSGGIKKKEVNVGSVADKARSAKHLHSSAAVPPSATAKSSIKKRSALADKTNSMLKSPSSSMFLRKRYIQFDSPNSMDKLKSNSISLQKRKVLNNAPDLVNTSNSSSLQKHSVSNYKQNSMVKSDSVSRQKDRVLNNTLNSVSKSPSNSRSLRKRHNMCVTPSSESFGGGVIQSPRCKEKSNGFSVRKLNFPKTPVVHLHRVDEHLDEKSGQNSRSKVNTPNPKLCVYSGANNILTGEEGLLNDQLALYEFEVDKNEPHYKKKKLKPQRKKKVASDSFDDETYSVASVTRQMGALRTSTVMKKLRSYNNPRQAGKVTSSAVPFNREDISAHHENKSAKKLLVYHLNSGLEPPYESDVLEDTSKTCSEKNVTNSLQDEYFEDNSNMLTEVACTPTQKSRRSGTVPLKPKYRESNKENVENMGSTASLPALFASRQDITNNSNQSFQQPSVLSFSGSSRLESKRDLSSSFLDETSSSDIFSNISVQSYGKKHPYQYVNTRRGHCKELSSQGNVLNTSIQSPSYQPIGSFRTSTDLFDPRMTGGDTRRKNEDVIKDFTLENCFGFDEEPEDELLCSPVGYASKEVRASFPRVPFAVSSTPDFKIDTTKPCPTRISPKRTNKVSTSMCSERNFVRRRPAENVSSETFSLTASSTSAATVSAPSVYSSHPVQSTLSFSSQRYVPNCESPKLGRDSSERKRESPSIFKDIDDELPVHFRKPARKSYERPKRRYEALYMTDEDWTEDELPVKETHPKVKRTKKSKIEKKLADKWVAGFNFKCKEVEEFELCIE